MAGLFGTCPEKSYERAVSEYNNSRSQETRDKDGVWLSQAVADRSCKQENKKKCVNEVDTWQMGLSKFLSPSDILGSFLEFSVRKEGWG
jgi:hypothetical protein